MEGPAMIYVDSDEVGRTRMGEIHRRIAPHSTLTQLADLAAARKVLNSGASFHLALVATTGDLAPETLSFLRWMRRHHPEGPPAFLLQDELDPCLVVKAVEAGADGVIPTKVGARALEQTLRELFELHLVR